MLRTVAILSKVYANPKVSFVLEAGHKNANESFLTFAISRNIEDEKYSGALNSIAFAGKRSCIALQLADLFVYLNYRHAKYYCANRIMLPANALLAELSKGAKQHDEFLDAEELSSIKLTLIAEDRLLRARMLQQYRQRRARSTRRDA